MATNHEVGGSNPSGRANIIKVLRAVPFKDSPMSHHRVTSKQRSTAAWTFAWGARGGEFKSRRSDQYLRAFLKMAVSAFVSTFGVEPSPDCSDGLRAARNVYVAIEPETQRTLSAIRRRAR